MRSHQSSTRPWRIAVLISGSGRTMQNLMHESSSGNLDADIVTVVSSVPDVRGLEIAAEAGIPTHVPSPKEFGYRSRAEFQVSPENHLVGYFADNSKTIVDVKHCPLLTENMNMLLTTLRDDVEAGLVPKTAREYRAVAGDFGTALEQTNSPRSATLQQRVGEFDYRFSAECFFQANIDIAAELVKGVMQIATQARSEKGYAADLYAGVGLFSLPLAKVYRRILAVESHKPAVAFLKENLVNNGFKRSKVISTPVEHWVSGDVSRYGRVAFMVFDPPRTGAGDRAVQGMIKMNPAHVAAVSCDPATFARDLKGFIDGGYELVSVKAYDMFPQTHHVEILAHLKRIDV